MTPFDLLRRWVVPGSRPHGSPFPPPAEDRPAEAKSSRAGPLISLHFVGRPVWTPRDYAGLAREGYARNPIVYRCVRLISEAASSVPWLLYQGRHELDRHPLLDLLARPNPRQSGPEFLEELYGHLLVSGNAYVEAVAIGNVVRELYCLRPDRVKVVPGPEGWPEAWDYTVAERSVRFSAGTGPVRPILNLNLFHPLNDYYGMAPIEAAQVSLDVHNSASAWAKSLIDNSARPSGALVYQSKDGSNLSDDQFTRLKKELEDGFQGAGNAGRPLLLEGGLDWKSMGLSPKDMDFIEAKRDAAREIALAFGVPSMILGIPGDLTHANYAEANRAFWRSTVLPLISRTAQALGTWLDPAFGPGLRLAFNSDQIEALALDRDAMWRRVDAATFLSDDEKRAAVGYGPRPPAAAPAAASRGDAGPGMSLDTGIAAADADPASAAPPAGSASPPSTPNREDAPMTAAPRIRPAGSEPAHGNAVGPTRIRLLAAPERKRAADEVATVSADGEFSGYASLFGIEDMSRDVVERGAFLASLRHRGASGVKMLYQHDPAEPIGRWLDIRETARGLFVVGQLMPDIARAREVLAMMRAGVIDGLSIGFKTVKGRTDAKSGIRRLAEVDLWEISVVTFPMQPAARVASVKSASGSPPATRCLAASPFAPGDAEEDRRLASLFRRLAARVAPGG